MAKKEDLNKQIQQEINKLSGDTEKYWQGILDKLIKAGAKGKELEQVLSSIKKITSDWEESIQDLANEFSKIQNQIREVDTVENQAKRSLKEYNDIQKQILNHKNKQRLLTSDELKDLKSKAQIEFNKLSALGQATSKMYADHSANVELLNEEIKKWEKIEKNLKNVSTVLTAMGDIPIFGKLLDINKALAEAKRKAEAGGSALAVWGTAFKSMGKSLFENLTNPFNILVFAVQGFVSLLKNADKSIGDLAKGMNVSYGSAAAMSKKMGEAAKQTGDIYDNIHNWSQSLVAINQSLGTSATVSDKTLKTFSNLRDKAGYTNEELASIYRLTLATGGELENNVASFAGTVRQLNLQNKLRINEKQLLKDVAKTSDAIKLSVGGTVEAIAKAAFKAKQFGINLEQADKISEGLLNFEESISNELSAELLTGKNLNLEKARLLALNGDIAGASAEILEQLGGSAEFANMNRIQQEAIAKAVGLSRDELAKSLVEREALAAMGADDAEEAQKMLEARAAQVGWEQAIKEQKDEAYAQQLAQNSLAEDMEQIMFQIQAAFIPIAQDLLPKIKDFFDKNQDSLKGTVQVIGDFIKGLADLLSNTEQLHGVFSGVKMILVGLGALKLTGLITQLASAAVASGALSAGAITAASAITFGIAAIAIAAGVATMMSAYNSASEEAKAKAAQKPQDGFAPSSKGPFTITDSFGATAITAKGDNLAISPNINTSQTNTASNSSVNIESLRQEQQKTNDLLARLLSKEGIVRYDTDIAGKTTNMGTYSIQ